MLKKTGIPTEKELAVVLPSAERFLKGPVAIIECLEEIPCNPCADACRQGAIGSFKNINALPTINHEMCNGCGVCISRCPGLAIFVVDRTHSQEKAVVRIPWEMPGRIKVGQMVQALDRAGRVIGSAEVLRVQEREEQDRTKILWLAVHQDLALQVRSIEEEKAHE